MFDDKKINKVNRRMNKPFKDYGTRASSSIGSEAELANREIQEQFYENKDEDNLLPFHVDVNNPPIKK